VKNRRGKEREREMGERTRKGKKGEGSGRKGGKEV